MIFIVRFNAERSDFEVTRSNSDWWIVMLIRAVLLRSASPQKLTQINLISWIRCAAHHVHRNLKSRSCTSAWQSLSRSIRSERFPKSCRFTADWPKSTDHLGCWQVRMQIGSTFWAKKRMQTRSMSDISACVRNGAGPDDGLCGLLPYQLRHLFLKLMVFKCYNLLF